MDLYTIRNEFNQGKSIYDLDLKVTYYARVSTDKDEQLHSIQNQIDYYETYIRANAHWTFADGYIDEGLSGTSVAKRESFLRMMDDAALRKFDFIITKEISRFSRNTLDSIHYTQQLLRVGVGVLFQSDNINTLMPDAELRLTIMSSIAQDEVRKISERVKFGFKRAVEKGVVLGSNRIWGYQKDAGKLVVVAQEAEMIQKIFDLYANQNLGMRSICSELSKQNYQNSNGNDFSCSTIKGILTNPKYKGYYCGNKTHKTDYKLSDIQYLNTTEWVMYQDKTGDIVPAIVSEALWERANAILEKRSRKQKACDASLYAGRYIYSGKIMCAKHNVPYYRTNYHYKSGSKEAWQCKLYTEKGKAGCASPIIYTAEIDKIMQQAAELILENKEEILREMVNLYLELEAKANGKEKIAQYRAAINDYCKAKDKLLDLSVKGRIADDEFEARNEQFNEKMKKLELKIEESIKQEIQNREKRNTVEALQNLIADELHFADGFSAQLTDALLHKLVVYQADSQHEIPVEAYCKGIEKTLQFKLKRQRGKDTSVRYTPYI